MGREGVTHKYECLDCYYGCKGHEIKFEGNTTSMTARLQKDGEYITPYLLYEDFEAIFEGLKKVFVEEPNDKTKGE